MFLFAPVGPVGQVKDADGGIKSMVGWSEKRIVKKIKKSIEQKLNNEGLSIEIEQVVNDIEFKRLINNQEFLEYAKVFSNFYGTTRTPVIDRLNKGKNVLFDIDWQGADQIKNKKLKIFIIILQY